MQKNIRIAGALVAVAVLLIGALPVYAQTPLVPCSGLDCNLGHFFVLFARIYNFLLGLAAVTAVLMIVLSGIRMLTYFWSETPDQDLVNAKNSLRRAVTGFVIIVAAYLIVNTLLANILGASPLDFYLNNFQNVGNGN